MATVSTLASPGVEVREFDESLRVNTSTGTTVFIPGFAAQGPVEEINSIGSMDDFENIYGQPTNAAERYFYYTVKSVVDKGNNGVTILTSRIAYGSGDGDNVSNAFTLLAYPAIAVAKSKENPEGFDCCTLDSEAVKTLMTLKKTESGTIEPTTVTPYLIIDHTHTDFSDLKLTKLEIKGGFLPSVGESLLNYKSKPTLTWSFNSHTITTEGAVATESKDGDLIVHVSFALKEDATSIGILKIDARYKAADVAEIPYNTLTFNATTSEATATYVPAFKLVDKYSPEDDEEIPEYGDLTYVLGSPVAFQISLAEYYQLISGELFNWSNEPYSFDDILSANPTDDTKFGMFNALKHSAFIVVNPSRTIVNDAFEGYYFGITDNMFNTTETGVTLNAIDSIKITTLNSDQASTGKGLIDQNYQTMSRGRIDFYLDSNNQGSISQVLQNEINSFDTSTTEYDDTVNVGIFRLKKSTTANEVMKLTYRVAEEYNASFGRTRQYSVSSSTTPQNYFIENIIESSPNLLTLVNPYIAQNIFVNIDNILEGKVRVYSNKLLSNLKRLQAKYITGYNTTIGTSGADKTAIAPVNAATANIRSWGDVIKQTGVSLDILNNLKSKPTFTQSNSLYPFGSYTNTKSTNKYIGNVPYKLERILNVISNDEVYPDIDIICDGGLSTIYPYSNTTNLVGNSSLVVTTNGDELSANETDNAHIFDETVVLAGIEDLRTGRSSYSEYAQSVVEDYLSIQNAFTKIANSETNGGRGNTFYIADLPRGVFIKGKNTKVATLFNSPLTNTSYDDNELVNHSWSTSIVYPCKWLVDSFTSSFTSIYAQWFKIVDNFSGEKIWVPSSGKVAGLMCSVDALTGPWDAAAGLNRGLITDVLDVAINPTLPQRSDLYKLCINSIPSMPGNGPTVWGIRTLSKKASAFDQNTCRRTFLYMEKHIKQVLRYFVFERNDTYTQLRVYNEIDPFLSSLQAQGAIYNYTLVCDSTNNTDEVINEGNLIVSVAAAPERTIEKIVLNMTANKYTSSITTSLSA